jgi:hypothetical protein
VACCFDRPVDALCLAHRSIELLWIAGAFLVLEECPVSAAIDWVLVMCLNTEIGVSYVCSYVYVLFLRKVKVDLHVCQCRGLLSKLRMHKVVCMCCSSGKCKLFCMYVSVGQFLSRLKMHKVVAYLLPDLEIKKYQIICMYMFVLFLFASCNIYSR